MKIFFALLIIIVAVLLYGWGGLLIGGAAGILAYQTYSMYASGTDPPLNGNGKTRP